MFKINNKDTNDVALVFLMLNLNIFHTFFCCFIVDFEQENISWEWCDCKNGRRT